MNDPTDVLAIHILSSLYPMIGDSHGMVLHAPFFFLVRLNLPHVVLLGHRGRLRQPDGGLPRADAAGPWLQRVGEGTAFDQATRSLRECTRSRATRATSARFTR